MAVARGIEPTNRAAAPVVPPTISAVFLLFAGAAALMLPAGLSVVVAVIAGCGGLALMQLWATGRWPNWREALLDVVVVGALAGLRVRHYAVWQVPDTWVDVLRLSSEGSGVMVLVYVTVAATLLLRSHRHTAIRQAAAVFLLPLLFNLALLLGNEILMRRLGFWLTFEIAIDDVIRATIGRAIVLVLFAEMLTAALRFLVAGTWPREPKLHLVLVGTAIHAALGAPVADIPEHAAALGPVLQAIVGIVCAAFAQSGLWAFVYILTGVAIDALGVKPPSFATIERHWSQGWGKGAVYGGAFMALLLLAAGIAETALGFAANLPLLAGILAGALAFPLVGTVVASADETPPFFGRLKNAYREPRLYWRGAIVGFGVALAATGGFSAEDGLTRFVLAFVLGAVAYGGVDFAADLVARARGQRAVLESWRIYTLNLLLGGLVGGSLGWYFDTPQLAVVEAKFWSYVTLSGHPQDDFTVYPLFNKWGGIDLGRAGGGVKLFYDESLSGVINWGIAAPLFSINYFLLAALIDRNLSPLKQLFSAKGFEGLVEQAVRVLRWGLWMAPVINSFLRQSPDPTWYNQDGAVRSVAATAAQATLPASDYRAWSLSVFTGLLAYDWLRVLIWFDHMGLRVATLVNLTFLGGDRADEAAARFAGHAARTRIIPIGIRRFATWAPLLIPFYIPRGAEWDQAWHGAEQIRAHAPPLGWPVDSLLLAYSVAALGGIAVAVLVARRWDRARPSLDMGSAVAPLQVVRAPARFSLSNGLMSAELLPDGRGHTAIEAPARGGHAIDLSPKVTDPLAKHGPFLFLRDMDSRGLWSLGYEPLHLAGSDYRVRQGSPNSATLRNTVAGIRAEGELRLDTAAPIEFWRIRLTNLEDRPRRLRITSFREIVAHEAPAYRRDPDFNALHVQSWFLSRLNGLFLRNRLLRGAGAGGMSDEIMFHVVRLPEGARLIGYEDSRTRFLGQDGITNPAGLGLEAPRHPDDEGVLTTFDPAASLTIELRLPAGATTDLVFATGWAADDYAAVEKASELTGRPNFESQEAFDAVWTAPRDLHPSQETARSPGPFAFSPAGTELDLTDATPRPWAHVLANPLGFGTIVGNDGEIHSFYRNARQNALTPFRFESGPTQTPGQSVYVVDLDTGDADTAGFVPYRRRNARHDLTFAPGSATIRKARGTTELALTVFVPPDSPGDIRILTVRNRAQRPKRFRIVPMFEMALDESAEDSQGRLVTHREDGADTLLFNNPFNDFHKGWAFVTTSLAGATTETVRARFIGEAGRDLANPVFVDRGEADLSRDDDGRRVAAFAGTIEIPAGGEVEVVIVLGQADTRAAALEMAGALRDPSTAKAALHATRAWWTERLGAVRIETNDPAFDRLVNTWLPYQLLAARLWGRNGPNQRGGAFGFRDQLQDVLPLLLSDADLVRRQIVFHAAAQFSEGDVFKWWHMAPDGRIGLGQRTRASDPHLWLPYVLSRYIDATGDRSILEEMVPYLEGPPIPDGKIDLVIAPRQSREMGSLYGHCRRAVDYALARIGQHGLPLIGTGDWNDGFDAVGAQGRGESLWLAFFLHDVLRRFGPIVALQEGKEAAERLTAAAQGLKEAIARAWAGSHFICLYDDNGERIDPASIMTAAWPALSGAVEPDRARAALEHGLRILERPDRILLLSPAFDENSHPFPGRIADYPAGVRENGGQYSHGASWAVDAYMWLADQAKAEGEGDIANELRARAATIWRAISPLGKTDGPMLSVYGLAPHQQPADIYEGPGYAGRGGWSWYTGSAARMLSAAYALFGLRMEGGELVIPDDAFAPRGGLQLRSVTVHGTRHTAGTGNDDRSVRAAAR